MDGEFVSTGHHSPKEHAHIDGVAVSSERQARVLAQFDRLWSPDLLALLDVQEGVARRTSSIHTQQVSLTNIHLDETNELDETCLLYTAFNDGSTQVLHDIILPNLSHRPHNCVQLQP